MAVLIKSRDLTRIGAVVDQVESTAVNRKTSNRATSPIHQSGDMATVRVTSLTTTAGRYPGKLLQFNPTSGLYSDLIDIWVTEMNGDTLAIQRYPARRNGTADGTEATLPVFEVVVGGGGGGGGGGDADTPFTAVSDVAVVTECNEDGTITTTVTLTTFDFKANPPSP